MYEFDEGTSGAAEGPFLNWHARETLDGVIGSRSFSVRTEDGRADVTDKMKAGVAVDLDSLKTGWCYTTGTPGQSPVWPRSPQTGATTAGRKASPFAWHWAKTRPLHGHNPALVRGKDWPH